jgi:hypothetical protein
MSPGSVSFFIKIVPHYGCYRSKQFLFPHAIVYNIHHQRDKNAGNFQNVIIICVDFVVKSMKHNGVFNANENNFLKWWAACLTFQSYLICACILFGFESFVLEIVNGQKLSHEMRTLSYACLTKLEGYLIRQNQADCMSNECFTNKFNIVHFPCNNIKYVSAPNL